MSRYLEEAADLLRKAAATNERENARYADLRADRQVELAKQFAKLAAIDKGLLPREWVEQIVRQAAEARGE
ncbi:hypothetical protein ACQEU3_46595 [Spirillospora sp. CA-253888]